MKASQFNSWITQLSRLSPEQREQLKACLSAPGTLPQDMILPSLPVQRVTSVGLQRRAVTVSLQVLRQNQQPADGYTNGPRKRGGSAKRRGLSAEQISVLVVRDRSGQHADFQLEKLDAVHIGEPLRPLIDVDAILCSDSAAAYAHFAKAEGIAHRPVNPSQKRRVDGPFHMQNVNA